MKYVNLLLIVVLGLAGWQLFDYNQVQLQKVQDTQKRIEIRLNNPVIPNVHDSHVHVSVNLSIKGK